MSSPPIKLTGIAWRPQPGMPMQTRQSCHISIRYGLEGDSRGNLSVQKSNKRQITILSEEAWEAALLEIKSKELSLNLLDSPLQKRPSNSETQAQSDFFENPPHWSARRANLLISGKTFSLKDVGKTLCIGEVQLEITRETDPCGKMDRVKKGLKNALSPKWRGGVCAKVIQGGHIKIGDCILVSTNE